jgi:subtilisin
MLFYYRLSTNPCISSNGPPPPTAADTVNYPAKYNSVMAVSAIDSANTIASFSSRGPKVELCAPGVNILSTIPGGGYGTLSGTSMACPHVTGSVALALSSHRWPPPGLAHNVAIRRLLAISSDNLGIPGRDIWYGFGRVDAEEAAFSFAVPLAVPGIP